MGENKKYGWIAKILTHIVTFFLMKVRTLTQ